MELNALTTSIGNLLPELPDSPFDTADGLSGKECYPNALRGNHKGTDGGSVGRDRDSESLGVDADCMFAYDDNDRDSSSDSADGNGHRP